MRRLATLVLLLPAVAAAHSAFPQSLRIAPRAGASGHLLVASSVGLFVQSGDAGPWRWICEEGAGYGSNQRPVVLNLPSGRMWAGSFRGLYRSDDEGCTWSAVPTFADTGASDVVADPTTPDTLYAVTEKYGATNRLFRSTDRGETFLPTALARDQVFLSSVVVAPSAPSRLYVGGWWFTPTASAFLFRSDDASGSFQETDVTHSLPAPGAFFVHAVHPAQPDVLLASVNTTETPSRSILLRSTDRGATFTAVLELGEAINSVALSDDGATVWAASAGRLYRSDDAGQTFAALAVPTQNACVARQGAALLSCGWSPSDGWAVARSGDRGDTFTPAMRFSDVAGVLACPAGSNVRELCEPMWPLFSAQLANMEPALDGGAADGGEPGPGAGKPCGCGQAPGALALWAIAWGLWRRRGR